MNLLNSSIVLSFVLSLFENCNLCICILAFLDIIHQFIFFTLLTCFRLYFLMDKLVTGQYYQNYIVHLIIIIKNIEYFENIY